MSLSLHHLWPKFLQEQEPRLATIVPVVLQDALAKLETLRVSDLLNLPGTQQVPASDVLHLLDLHRQWRQWLEQATALAPQSTTQQSIPDEVWPSVLSRDRLAALERICRLFATLTTRPEDLASWQAALQLWQANWRLAQKETTWRCQVISSEHPRFSHYANLVGQQESLAELPSHRWLAARQGEQEGVLHIALTWPQERMIEQVRLLRVPLDPAFAHRTNDSLLHELVTDVLPGWLRRWCDERATTHALETALPRYEEMLTSAPLSESRVAACYIGGTHNAVAMVWFERKEPIHHIRFEHTSPDTLAAHLLKHIQERPVDALLLPLRAADTQLLQYVADKLRQHTVIHRVQASGMQEARMHWMEPPRSYRREEASALVLGRRMLAPLEEWGRLDPLLLGLVEYQNLLDTDRLQAALVAQREWIQAGRSTKGTSLHTPTGSAPGMRLNPLVQSLDDLRPGMVLQGIVANLVDFGAFVHIGLSEEGLVHLSELADRFVRHPSEVVRVGQRVSVRVLTVDQQQSRLSLSMRSEQRPSSRPHGSQKAQALKQLDNLFKKGKP